MGRILIPTSSINAAGSLWQAEVLSSVVSAVSYILTRQSKFLAQTHMFPFLSLVFTQALASKTLDQASAQFAASALVSTDQLLAFKSKEELVLASGVNGVLAGAGE